MRRPKAKAVLKTKVAYTCIGCGLTIHVRWCGMPGESQDKLARAVDEGCPLLAADGWRKLPDGWKCGECTGIRGHLEKHLRRLKPGRAAIVFDANGQIKSAKNIGRRQPP